MGYIYILIVCVPRMKYICPIGNKLQVWFCRYFEEDFIMDENCRAIFIFIQMETALFLYFITSCIVSFFSLLLPPFHRAGSDGDCCLNETTIFRSTHKRIIT